MGHVELNIDGGPDVGGEGCGFASLYFVDKDQNTVHEQVELGPMGARGDPVALIHRARLLTEEEPGAISPERLVAVAVTRLWWDSRYSSGPRPTLSRVGSFVVATAEDAEEVGIRRLPEPDTHGIGRISRFLTGTHPKNPLVHLPATPREQGRPILHVVRAAIEGVDADRMPYVALHSDPTTRYVEQFVPLGELL